jgi:hypothetical protein
MDQQPEFLPAPLTVNPPVGWARGGEVTESATTRARTAASGSRVAMSSLSVWRGFMVLLGVARPDGGWVATAGPGVTDLTGSGVPSAGAVRGRRRLLAPRHSHVAREPAHYAVGSVFFGVESNVFTMNWAACVT